MSEAKYKRVLLKLSGEALAGEQKTGVNVEVVGKICDKIKQVTEMGVEVAIVVGGGNFWRGRNGHQMERATADYMGILATAMNGIALQDALEARGVHSRVQTAIEIKEIAEPFILRKAEKHLSRGRVVIFAGGTGHAYFTTDTAAVLRAAEIRADIILLGKAIDAVYSADPKIEPNAEKYDKITNRHPLSLFGLRLPATLVVETCRFYEAVPTVRAPAEAEQAGENILTAYLASLVEPYGTVSSTLCSSRQKDGVLLVTLSAECVEEIGVRVPIYTEEPGESP